MHTQPITSREAYNNVKERGQQLKHGDIILNALNVKKQGNYEQIAMFCGLKPMQVVRRLSELERTGGIRKSGRTNKTSTGDSAVIWEYIEPTPAAPLQQASLFQ